MTGTNGQFRAAKDRKKKAPVKRVTVSAEAERAYEELVRARDERERNYGRHLVSSENKGR
jgi:hypothetical protein